MNKENITLTVSELKTICRGTLRCLSAYNGKVLCYAYSEETHGDEIGKRAVLDVWGEMITQKSPFGNLAYPILCAFVDGAKEYEKERAKKENGKREDD